MAEPTSHRSLRILGLDPGSRFTGWGVVERQGSRLLPVAHGRIVLPAERPLAERLLLLDLRIAEVLAEHRPQVAVLEALFHGANVRSLIVLAQARGAILAGVARSGVEIHEYAPAEVKTAVTGNGRADKQQVAKMVQLVLGLGKPLPSHDATDALAVAICFGQRARMDRLGGRNGTGSRPTAP